MKNLLYIMTFLVFIGLALSACTPLAIVDNIAGSPTPELTPQSTSFEAQVQSVEIQTMNTNPPQINAIVHGNLTESCATLAQSQVQYASNMFQISLMAVSPTDHGCVQVSTPFETTIALDTKNLPAGTYTVVANGVSAIFALSNGDTAPTVAPTLTPTLVPTLAPSAVPTSRGCTDSAAFVSDVTIPDNVLVAPGYAFTKTWRLKNTGSCTWNGSYLVHYISGATMTQQPGYYVTNLNGHIEPGQTVDISVGMTAPMQTGYYTSYWGLKGRDGQWMPIAGGANGNSFYVKIRVASQESGGNIVAQSIDIQLEQGSGASCTSGATYFVHAYITADGPLAALYEVDSTAGQIAAGNFVDPQSGALQTTMEGTVKFDEAMFRNGGTQTITVPFRFVGPYPYPDDITVNLWVDGAIGWRSAKLNCQ